MGAPFASNGYDRGSSLLSLQGDNVHSPYTTSAGMQRESSFLFAVYSGLGADNPHLALAATAAQAYYGSMCSPSIFSTYPYLVVGLGAYYPASNGGPNPGVYYYPPQPAPQQDGMNQQQPVSESKKRAFDGVDQFFEDAKRHKIQPVYDGNMAQRLSALQQFVPTTSGESVDFNGHHAATVTAPAPGQNQYTLPSLRTKQDLIDADHFLTQLSANVYESPAAAAAAGAPVAGYHAQPYRNNQPPSPHNNHNVQQQSPNHSPSSHDNAPATTAIMQSSTSTSSGGTSALTPTSNYTTSHSPNHQHSSPPTQSPQSAASMYPPLPSIPTSSEGYPSSVSTAPASSLGPTFDDSRRRISVGVLQKARPASGEPEDVDMDREDNTDKKSDVSDSLIDPELSGALSGEIPVPVVTEDPGKEWEKNVELLTNLREYVKSLLEKEEKREIGDGEDSMMIDHDGGIDTNVEPGQEGADGGGNSAKEQEEQTDAQALYPVLRAVAVA